jgi:hypothetical protein
MSGRNDKFLSTSTRQPRPERLLDRADRAVVRVARAAWRFLLQGFAAYGMAECAMSINPGFVDIEPLRNDSPVLATRYAYGAAVDDLPGDFEDIDALIRSLQTIGK